MFAGWLDNACCTVIYTLLRVFAACCIGCVGSVDGPYVRIPCRKFEWSLGTILYAIHGLLAG